MLGEVGDHLGMLIQSHARKRVKCLLQRDTTQDNTATVIYLQSPDENNHSGTQSEMFAALKEKCYLDPQSLPSKASLQGRERHTGP